MTINNKLIKIDMKGKLLTEDPQDQVIDLLSSNILLNQDGYSNGVLSLSSIPSGSSITAITSGSSGSTEVTDAIENFFLTNGEILVDECNTIILFSEYPFDLQINDNNIQTNLYHYSLTSDDYFSVQVANRSESNDVELRYLIASSSLLGSSYVHT